METVTYIPNLLSTPNDSFTILRDELAWRRIDTTPRMEYYCNDAGVPYTYGKDRFARTYEAQPWHPEILRIRALLRYYTEANFEVCFLNRYVNQSDHLGWHADDSPEMDDARPIAIVSLGVEREIWFRHKPNENPLLVQPKRQGADVEKLKLGNGSLALMAPGMQDTHQHRIPKAAFICGERISLTFRGYVAQES